MQLSDKIDITPFARILPFFAAGILAFRYVTAPDWLIVAAAVIGYAVAWRQRKGSYRWWTVAVALFFSGILVTAVSARKEAMPRGERLAADRGSCGGIPTAGLCRERLAGRR